MEAIEYYPNDGTNRLKYIAYVRKSTEEEERQALSMEAQIDAINKQFPSLNITFIKGTDGKIGESMSAAKPGRPLYNKMMEDLEAGEYQGVVAWHPDRLSRNAPDAARFVWDLQQNHIKDVKFCNFTFEKTPEGIMMLQMIMSQAQYFSAKLSKDIRRGNAQKRKKGGLTGVAPTGYINNRLEKTVEIDPERFPLMQKAFRMFLTGNYSVPEILNIMNNDWGFRTLKRDKSGGAPLSRNALYQCLGNIRYAGVIVDPHTGDQFKATYPAMITIDEYYRIQELLGRKGHPKLLKHDRYFALRGFIRCGQCGCLITAEEKKKHQKNGNTHVYRYYRCSHNKKGVPCHQAAVREEELYQQLKMLLGRYELIPELHEIGLRALHEIASNEISERDDIQDTQARAIDTVQRQLDRLLDMATRGLVSAEDYESKGDSLKKQLAELQKEQRATGERVKNFIDIMGNALSIFENINERFTDGDIIEKRRILSAVGSNPILTDGKLSVTEHFWLRPLVENKAKLTEEIRDVRTSSDLCRSRVFDALIPQWCWR